MHVEKPNSNGLIDTWLSLDQPNAAECAYLDRLQIPFRARHKCGGLRVARISHNGRIFSFNDEGKRALILGVWDDPPSIYRWTDRPCLTDLIAFQTSNPGRSWLYTGDGVLLGEAALDEARLHNLPLPVFRTPLSWLQHCGAGVVPLHTQLFSLALHGLPEIELVSEDLDHGKLLRQIVVQGTQLGLPTISVRV